MDFLHRVLYTAFSAISLLFFFVKYSLSHWKKRGILHEKPKFLWGNLKGVGSKKHIAAVLDDIYSRYKGRAPFIGFYAWLKPMVLALDIELVRRILIEDASHFRERGLYHNVDDDPLSENLIQLDRCAYEQLREKIEPIFENSRMQCLFPSLIRVAETFRRSLLSRHNELSVFNIKDLVGSYNTDVASLVAFGLEGDTLKYPCTEFRQMSRNYFNNINWMKLYFIWSFPYLANLFSYRTYNQAATTYFVNLVEKKLEERASSHHTKPLYPDLLQSLVDLKPADMEKRNKTRITAQCFSYLLAGLEASNTTLTFCLYELSLHLAVQDKARQEIENVLSEHKDKLTVGSINDMVYLKQILHETLRKYSPYPFLLRNTVKEYEIPNSVFMLQEGNSIIIPISSIHHDPVFYPNPQKFDPSRFDAEAVAQRHPAVFLPFGLGPRSCFTREFAEMQMMVCLVTVLRQFRFTSCEKTSIMLHYDPKKLLLSPKNDIELRLERI